MRTAYIYGLLDPRTGAIEYIGRSVHPEKRFRQHFRTRRGPHLRGAWFRDMLDNDIEPEVVILGEAPEKEAWREESRLINLYREMGEARANNQIGRVWPPVTETPTLHEPLVSYKPRYKMTGDELRAFRAERGLSQRPVAAACGVTISCVSRWESGNRSIPTYAILLLAEEFGYEPVKAIV